MPNSHSQRSSYIRGGSAIIIVLAFVVLLTGLVVAFFSRAMSERQVSNSSANDTKAELFARGATDTIIGDLKQEIVAGSAASSPATGVTIYAPNSPGSMVPALAGSTGASGLQNLLKRSAGGVPFYTGANYAATGTARASSVNSYLNPSLNNRSVSPARWNKVLLMQPASSSDFTPASTIPFTSPDWILVARDGSNPTAWNSNMVTSANSTTTIVGRYAYAIYDEGGLLDMNVAGYPSTTGTTQFACKPALAYADLTQLTGSSGSPLLTGSQIDQIVGWRNYASAQPTGTFPGYTFASGSNYYNFVISNQAGFLTASNQSIINNQTDRLFFSRQQLINLVTQGAGASVNVMQYLGTFSRDIDQPSYIRPQSTNPAKTLDYNPGVPKVLSAAAGGNNYGGQNLDDQANPSFLSVRVQPGKTFTRNDGSTAQVGDPLVKKRFALNRLAWLTYKGPSASRNQSDADMQALINAGIPWSYLQQGTAANIQKYFGLAWDSTNYQWDYNVHNGASGGGPTGAIMLLGNIAALASPHEPDFFELLKATINIGSLGKALVPSNTSVAADSGASQSQQPYNYNYYPESSVDFQVIQIGANIINQFQPSNYPAQIVFNDGSGSVYSPRTIVGVENLPYLYNVISGVLQVQAPNPLPRSDGIITPLPTGSNAYPVSNSPGSAIAGSSGYATTDTLVSSGVGALMEMPVIWNPHDPSSPMTNATGLSPTSIRVVADSTTPDQAGAGAYNSFFVYAGSVGTTVSSGASQYSYAADPSSPGAVSPGTTGNTWYYDTSGNGNTIKHLFQTSAGPSGTGNAEIDITVTNGSNTPFPEPTILMRPGSIQDRNGNTATVSVPSSHLMRNDPAVQGFFANGGLPNYFANAPDMQPGETQDAANTSYLGFYLGAFPLAWKYSPTAGMAALSAGQTGCVLSRYTGGASTPAGSLSACYMTYRMQYKDPNTGNWITYDTKYGKVTNDFNLFGVGLPGLICGDGGKPAGYNDLLGLGGFWASAVDPRTSRFGLLWTSTSAANSMAGGFLAGPTPEPEFENSVYWSSNMKKNATGWLDTASGILYTTRPDADTGSYFSSMTSDGCWPAAASASSGWMAWAASNANAYPGVAPGLLSGNNADIPYEPHRFYGSGQGNFIHTPNYFADPDGMVRRGMGAFVASGVTASPSNITSAGWQGLPSCDTTVGLPMARAFGWNSANTNVPTAPIPTITNFIRSSSQTTSQTQSRPYFLHRPFYSVAELSYVFSDTPWRNLDFSTAESGNPALLDVFCINDTEDPNGLVAGKVDINTRQTPVLQAVLAGAYLDPVQPGSAGATGRLDATTAQAVATALTTRTADTANIPNGTGPLQNLSELVGKWVANKSIGQLPGLGTNKGTLASANGFYDGKLSYAGFSGGVWDNTSTNLSSASRKPFANGVENFSSATGAPLSTGTAEDIYSAYMGSSTFSSTGSHNGTQETAVNIQRFREAPIRALASAGEARVWNLMIDVVAQSGRYPQTATTLPNFLVEGEQRYWVHVAIDRYTGQVIDKQIEVVKE